MDKKMEEMIALGVAYAVNCQICMEYHKEKAQEAGLTYEEMQAAIQVAEGVKTAAANMTKKSADDLFGEIQEKRCCAVGSVCCP
jgi:AhpD family alkylhydroperoxidase